MGLLTGIITGAFLLNGVRRQTSKGPNEIVMNGSLRIAQNTPGRLRVYCGKLKNPDLANALAAQLKKIDGINQTEANPLTGSLLILYRQEKIKDDMLIACLIRLLDLDGDSPGENESGLTREVRLVTRSINYAILDRTKGLLDFKSTIAVAFVAMAVKKYVQNGSLGSPSGISLLYWALTQFGFGGEKE